MTIRDMWSFDNAPVGTNLIQTTQSDQTKVTGNTTNPYNYYTQFPGCVMNYVASAPTNVSADGFLTFTRAAAGTSNPLWFQLNQVFAFSGSQKFAFGFRTKSSVTVANTAAQRIFSTVNGWNSSLAGSILTEGDVAAPANTEVYVECFVDLVGGQLTVYANGVQVRQTAITSAAWSAGLYVMMDVGGTAATASSTRGYRDFYFLDIDSVDSSRLGPIRSKPAGLTSLSGSEWTLNGGNTSPVLVGSATISTTQSKFGGASLSIGQTSGAAASMPNIAALQFPGDFTVEMWMYPTSSSVNGILAGKGAQALLWWANGGRLQLTLDGGSTAVINYTASLTLNAWHHVALTRQGTLWTIWLDGVSVGTYTGSNTWGNNSNNLYIGNGLDQTGWGVANGAFPGYIDEVRISSVARYTAGFTPAAAAFTSDANTIALLHLDSANGTSLVDATASLSSALTMALQNPPTTTPSASAPADYQILSAQLNVSLPGSGPVIAVQPVISLIGDAAANMLDLTLSQASQNTDLGNLTLPVSANQFNARWGIQRTAPDGGVWTSAKLAATTALLTPAAVPRLSLLAHFDGTNGASTSTDSSPFGLPLTFNGSGKLSNAQAKYGPTSYYGAGATGAFVSTPDNTNLRLTSDYTVEFWIYPTQVASSFVAMYKGSPSPNTGGRINVSGGAIYAYDDGLNSFSGGSLAINTWSHVALVKSGTTTTLYLNGVSVGSSTALGAWGNNTYPLCIGAASDGTYPTTGYIDDVRVSTTARYKSTFTPPPAPFSLDGMSIASAFNSTNLTATQQPSSATTTTALVNAIAADAKVNLVPEDVVSASVPAQATTVTLTIAATSVSYKPGSTVTLTFAARAKTSLLMHFDNAGTTAYTDDLNHAVTNTGAAAAGSGGKFGAGYFPSGAGYLSVADATDLHMTGDFTIEFWLWHNNISQNGMVLAKGTSAQSGYQYIQSITGIVRIIDPVGSVVVGTADNSRTLVNTWQHFAFVKSGSQWSCFVDGVLTQAAVSTQPFGNNTYPLWIGQFLNGSTAMPFAGRVDELRISSMARYTTSFNVPSAPFTVDANTVMLMHMDDTTDATGRTWTSNGNGAITTAAKQFGTSSYQPNSSGNLSAANDASMILSGQFTWECWAYRTSALGDTTIFSSKTANDSTHQISVGQQTTMGLAIQLTDGAGWQSLAPSPAFPLNQWNHVAIVYQNGAYTGFINGVATGVVKSAIGFGLSGGTMTIGGNQYNTASQFPGYLDEMRVSNVARYPTSFTPPAAAFVAD